MMFRDGLTLSRGSSIIIIIVIIRLGRVIF